MLALIAQIVTVPLHSVAVHFVQQLALVTLPAIKSIQLMSNLLKLKRKWRTNGKPA